MAQAGWLSDRITMKLGGLEVSNSAGNNPINEKRITEIAENLIGI